MNPNELFGALAEPTRLRILALLQDEKEICVCDLCAVLGEGQPKVSRHLARLRRVGLVDVRQEGRWKFYSLARDESPLKRGLIRCVAACGDELPELRADRQRLRGLALRMRCA